MNLQDLQNEKSIIKGKDSCITICIAGKNDIAVNVLKYCLEKYGSSKKIVCVLTQNDNGINSWQRSLKWYCVRANISIITLEEAYEIENLLFLSVEFDRIIKTSLFKTDKLFNLHFSLLPEYKGMYPAVLPILQDKKMTGVTLHIIRDGIDTGEIVSQKAFKIDDNDTALDVYRKLIKYGTDLVNCNIDNLLDGSFSYVVQSVENSTYYSSNAIDYSDLQLDIRKTAYQIKNQVRAFSFRPYQLPKFNGIGIIECEPTFKVSNKRPGTVEYETETLYQISTIDYDVILYKDVLEKLFEAIRAFDNDQAKRLCECNRIVNEQDEHGWSALIVSVYSSNVEMVQYLLKIGANPNVVNNNGTTLLMYAKDAYIQTHSNELYCILKKYGLKEEQKDYYDRDLFYYIKEDGICIDKFLNTQ